MSYPAETLRGRDAELAQLGHRLTAATEGRGGVVLVSGEAGIGKSALADAAASEAERRGFRVITGRAWEFADAPPYFPVRSGLRALGVAPAMPAASDADNFAVWEDLLEALARECAKTPLFWLIEDLHAADAQSVELLAFLAQPLRAIPALILVTARSGDPRASDALLPRLTRLVRDGANIELGRLGQADVVALASRVAGQALPPGSIDAWMARTGGNPLFVVECARAVRAGRNVESALPETVVQVVLERLQRLPASTRGFLEQGAVLGRDFAAATVARLAERLAAVVIDGLLPALKAGLLEETRPGRFRFGHALVRDAIEEAMPPPERRQWHARAEAALADQGDATDVLVERARHAIEGLGAMAEAQTGELVTRAVAALEAEAARDRAFALWRRWLDARSAGPDSLSLLQLARLATAAGNHGEAQRAAESAFALAKSANDPVRVAQAALAQGAHLGSGIVHATLVRALEEALAGLSAVAEPSLACRVRVRLAAALQPAVDPAPPVAMAREALRQARAIGDDALLREVLFVGGSALTYFVDAAETYAIAGELLSLSLAAGDSARALRAFTRQIIGHLEHGDFAAFDADTDRMLALARTVGHPSHVWRPLLVGSMRALARGNFEESERLITEIEQMAGLIDDPTMMILLLSHKSYRATLMTDDAAIRAALATALPQLQSSAKIVGDAHASLHMTFWVGLDDRANIAAHIPMLQRYVSRVPPDAPLNALLGEAVALAGTMEQRAALLAHLLPFADREAHTSHVTYTYEGPFARVIGLLEASLGRTDAADARLEATRQRCRAFGLRPWVARLSLERGQILSTAGRSDQARPLIEEAAALAAELGMSGIETRARHALGQDRSAPPSTAPAERAALELACEGEVWRIGWADRVARVRDSRGVQLLAKLVAAPGERIHALALAGDNDAFLPESDAGDALDRKAIGAYRARLSTLDRELAAAESDADGARMERYRRERAMLAGEISRAVGLGGRLRKIGSATERARINVTRRLKDAIARIAEADAGLGRHLEAAIRTGTYCSYSEKP